MNGEELRKQKDTLIRDMSREFERITFQSAQSTTPKSDGDDESAIAVGWGEHLQAITRTTSHIFTSEGPSTSRLKYGMTSKACSEGRGKGSEREKREITRQGVSNNKLLFSPPMFQFSAYRDSGEKTTDEKRNMQKAKPQHHLTTPLSSMIL